MQFVLVIYHGTYPLPGTPGWESVSEEEKKAVYADYAALNKMEKLTPGPRWDRRKTRRPSAWRTD